MLFFLIFLFASKESTHNFYTCCCCFLSFFLEEFVFTLLYIFYKLVHLVFVYLREQDSPGRYPPLTARLSRTNMGLVPWSTLLCLAPSAGRPTVGQTGCVTNAPRVNTRTACFKYKNALKKICILHHISFQHQPNLA